jgi:hypothetical protein
MFWSRAPYDEALTRLAEGGRVLFMPRPSELTNSIPGFFASDFWCYPMFRRGEPPGTLGILCDPKHPALAQFPTEFHSNWQWFDILMHSRAMILDDLPADFRPIVQVIDNFDADRSHKLGLIFDLGVGQGKLLICTSDLPALLDHPEARSLLVSLVAYARQCEPPYRIAPADLRNWFRK